MKKSLLLASALVAASAFVVQAGWFSGKPKVVAEEMNPLPMAGGSVASEVDATATSMAEFALKQIGHQSNDLNAQSLELVRVKDVKTQVVAGTNYHMTLEAKDASGHTYTYEVTVWDRPWLQGKEAETNEVATQLTNYKLV